MWIWFISSFSNYFTFQSYCVVSLAFVIVPFFIIILKKNDALFSYFFFPSLDSKKDKTTGHKKALRLSVGPISVLLMKCANKFDETQNLFPNQFDKNLGMRSDLLSKLFHCWIMTNLHMHLFAYFPLEANWNYEFIFCSIEVKL